MENSVTIKEEKHYYVYDVNNGNTVYYIKIKNGILYIYDKDNHNELFYVDVNDVK